MSRNPIRGSASKSDKTSRGDVTDARHRSSKEMFSRIAHYLKRYPWFALSTMGCALLSTVMALAYPKLTQLIIDRVVVGGDHAALPYYVLGLALAFAMRDIFNGLRIRLNNTFEQNVIFDIRRDLYAKLQRLPISYYDQRATGDIMTRVLDDVTAFERVLIDGLEQGAVALLTLAGVTWMLFQYHSSLALLAMIPIPVLAGGAYIFTLTAHHRYRIQRKAVSAMNALLHDNLQGIRQIKGFAREDHECARFQDKAQELRHGTLVVMRAWSVYSPSMAFGASMGMVLILYFGGLKAIEGQLTVGQLVGFLAYLTMFYDPIGRLHQLNQLFQAGRAAGERVFDILEAEEESPDREGVTSFPARVRGEVRFTGIHFGYGKENDREVLHEITFDVPAGKTVALVGPTGAGKTTVLNLLPRFYEITKGRIEVDGREIRDISLKSLRQQIGVVSQEPFLFNGSIRENLMFGKLNASESEMVDAAKAANAHEFITRLPDGYDSKVGERGVKLSVGEKQRVSIARALLKDPPILLLDEATASVDTGTEKLIQEALEHLMAERTCLMIAHRLSTVRHADLILVMEQGRIRERGTHEELIAQGGLYAHLCKIQGAGRIEEVLIEAGRN